MGGGVDWFNDGVCESGEDHFCSVHPRLIFQQDVNFIGGLGVEAKPWRLSHTLLVRLPLLLHSAFRAIGDLRNDGCMPLYLN